MFPLFLHNHAFNYLKIATRFTVMDTGSRYFNASRKYSTGGNDIRSINQQFICSQMKCTYLKVDGNEK